MTFSSGDWWSVFGALLLNGVALTGVGTFVWMRAPPGPATTGLAVVMLDLGLFCLTAMGHDGLGRFSRLHVATAALVVPTLCHFALGFPLVRLGRHRRPVLVAIYGLTGPLIAAYAWLDDPTAYSIMLDWCLIGAGVVGAGLIASAMQAYFTSTSLLVRKRLEVATLGMVAALAVPPGLLTAAGVLGGESALAVATCTAFLFPLSLAYAVLQPDLFALDAMVRRATSGLVSVGIGATAYAGLVLLIGSTLQTVDPARSAMLPLVVGLLIVFVTIALRGRVQPGLNRLCRRTVHDARRTLERARGALVTTLDLDDISTLTVEIVCQSLIVRDASLWLREGDDFALAHAAGAAPALRGPLAARPPGCHPLIAHLRTGVRFISSYDRPADRLPTWDERRRARGLRDLGGELMVPLGVGDPLGFLVVGPKESGRMLTLDDVDFLGALATQVAVAVRSARAQRGVEERDAGRAETTRHSQAEMVARL